MQCSGPPHGCFSLLTGEDDFSASGILDVARLLTVMFWYIIPRPAVTLTMHFGRPSGAQRGKMAPTAYRERHLAAPCHARHAP